MAKKRLDIYVYEHGYSESREKAKAIIMSGIVFVNNQRVIKPGTELKDSDVVEVRGNKLKYVSRGGLKLEKAINSFQIDLNDMICMDIGASTGGFTDCMLQNNAKKVYSVDVGYGQFAWKLRNDPRVVCLEKTNFRYFDNDILEEKLDFASIDVSFISLKLILPKLSEIIKDSGCAICLIKPQFEAGKGNVGKKGVVRDKNIHIDVINNVFEYAISNGFSVTGLDYSPVKGPEGNIEYLMLINYCNNQNISENINIEDVVKASHEDLDNENSSIS